MSDTPQNHTPPQIIGTQEFAEKYERLVRHIEYLTAEEKLNPLAVRDVRDLIDAAILEAYSAGFDEGVCK